MFNNFQTDSVSLAIFGALFAHVAVFAFMLYG